MHQSSVYITDIEDLEELEEELEGIENQATRVYRRRAPEPVLTRRRAQTRARLGLVSALMALVILQVSIRPPNLPTSYVRNRPPYARWTAAELLIAPDADALATALRRAFLPSHTVHLTTLGLDADTSGLSLRPVSFGGISVGEPHRGRLYGGVVLPENPNLYTVRRSEFAFGSTHAVLHLQMALAKFRDRSKYTGPLIVSDLSASRGGRHRPHLSHQSGRDVDLWLPLHCDGKGVTLKGGDAATGRIDFEHFSAARPQEVDWDASWQLVKALVRTGQIEGIFLARGKHGFLRNAALRDGLKPSEADEIIQSEQHTLNPMVRHVRGHDKHLHVRFRCADYEAYCR